MNIFLDIETIPEQPEDEARAVIAKTITAPAQMKDPKTIKAWHDGEGKYSGVKNALIEEKYRKSALDGGLGQICSIAYKSAESNIGFSECHDNEKVLIEQSFESIHESLKSRPPFFVGHNIEFDLRFLFHRAVILGVRPPFKLNHNGRHDQHYFDTMREWAGYRGFVSLDAVCKALGLEGKGDISGADVWDLYREREFKKISSYNMSDVLMVEQIFNRMTFRCN